MSRFGARFAAVVGRTLLVAERLEAILEVLLELLVELLGLQPEGFLVRALAAANDGLAQREQELPQPFLAPFRLDELERRVPEVVGQTAVLELHALEVAHRRHVVGDGGVAHGHEVEGIPVAGHVVGEPFVDPQRQPAAEQRSGDDVELEDVRQFVGDEAVERIGWFVDRQDHPVPIWLGEGEHPFGQL